MPERESKYFAKIALPEIVPVILRLLTRQEEDAEDDEWNISMAAGTCLTLLSQAVGDNIVSFVVPFIESNIKSPDWHHREAAVMTFGSILDGPDPQILAPLVTQALPLLIDMMQDSNTHVKDTTAWTLGRICDILVTTIKPETHLHHLIQALVAGLDDSPRIVTNASWALMTLSDQINDGAEDAQTGHLSPYYEPIVTALMRVTERYSYPHNYLPTILRSCQNFKRVQFAHSRLRSASIIRDTLCKRYHGYCSSAYNDHTHPDGNVAGYGEPTLGCGRSQQLERVARQFL
jgi:importin subunit beta-1